MDILLNPVTKALGWTIIHSLWQGAVVYVMLVGLLKFYPKLSSGLKYNLSFSAMLGISGWALLTFSNELLKFKNAVGPQDYHHQFSNAAINNLPSLMDRSIPLLVMIYLIGICFHVSLLIFDFYKMNTLRTTGLSTLAPDLQHQFSHLASGMGITKKVWFNISSKVTVPVVTGYLKPIILLPLSAITQLDSKQLESIIIHELSHIRRNDYLLNLAKIFMETVLFFNPFVLMTGRIINIERENACDDLVVGLTNDPLIYVESLLEIQKINYYQDRFSLAATGKTHYLLERIKRLTNGDVTNSHIKQPLTLLAILSLFFLLTWAPVDIKKVVTSVSVVKKEVQVKKTPVTEKLELKILSKVQHAPQSVTLTSEVKTQSQPDKLPEVTIVPKGQDPENREADHKPTQLDLIVGDKKKITVSLEESKSSNLAWQTIHYKKDDDPDSEAKTMKVPYKTEDAPYSQSRSTTIFLNSGDVPGSPARTTTVRFNLDYTPGKQLGIEMLDGLKIVPK